MARRLRIVQDRLASSDLREHVTYLAQHSNQAAVRFLDAAEGAVELLADNPGLGFVWGFERPEIQDVRVWPIPGFRNYLIFYRANEEALRIMRVLHGARDIEAVFDQ